MSKDICTEKDLMPKSNAWLNEFAKSVTSQSGEDGIIEKILEVIGQTNNWCVEFGSWDGKKLSNTYNLIVNHDYSAVLIEGNSKRFKVLEKNFKDNPKVIPVKSFVGFNESDCLDKILEKTDIPEEFDLLSIDIDGSDYHVWQAVQKYTPKVVVIEFNPTVPACVEFFQARDMTVNQGSGILSMVNLAKQKGYELIAVESANAFFVKKQYFELFGISDNSIDQLWLDQSAVTHIFFGYDSTVFLRGLKVHPWQNIAIDESKMQLLPKWARKKFGKQNYFIRKLAKYYRKAKKVRIARENQN